MTSEDAVYGEWLDLLGSGLEEGPELSAGLKRLHDRAEASHQDMDDYAAAQADAIRLGTEA